MLVHYRGGLSLKEIPGVLARAAASPITPVEIGDPSSGTGLLSIQNEGRSVSTLLAEKTTLSSLFCYFSRNQCLNLSRGFLKARFYFWMIGGSSSFVSVGNAFFLIMHRPHARSGEVILRHDNNCFSC